MVTSIFTKYLRIKILFVRNVYIFPWILKLIWDAAIRYLHSMSHGLSTHGRSRGLFTAGTVYSWGWNEHGMCGTGDEENVTTPQPVKSLLNKYCTYIGCGAGHSFALCAL